MKKEEDLETVVKYFEDALSKLPALNAAKPTGYPRGKDYKINSDQLESYSKSRAKDWWNHLNLPMVIYSKDFGEETKLRPLCDSILEHLEWFCKTMGNLPGAKKILEPLWNDAWSDQPRFWSVLGEVALSRVLVEKSKLPILGFDRKIGAGQKTADILVDFNGTKTHIDIELQHIRKEMAGSEADVRRFVEERAKKKIEKKFEDLPGTEFGVVAMIFMLQGENLLRFDELKSVTAPFVLDGSRNKFARVYWFVGGTLNGNFGLYLIDQSTDAFITPKDT